MQYPPTSDSSVLTRARTGSVTSDESSQRDHSAPRFDGTQACLGADPALFFPAQGGNARASIAAAKALCASCQFLQPCLVYAVGAQGIPGRFVSGVWGGTTEAERVALRRGRGRIRHLAASS